MSYPNSLKSCRYDPDSLIFQGLDKSLLIAVSDIWAGEGAFRRGKISLYSGYFRSCLAIYLFLRYEKGS
jgi:hypothetical protein